MHSINGMLVSNGGVYGVIRGSTGDFTGNNKNNGGKLKTSATDMSLAKTRSHYGSALRWNFNIKKCEGIEDNMTHRSAVCLQE